MCLAMERKQKRDEITGAIKLMKYQGASENDIIKEMMEMFNVTKDYVLPLLTAQKV